MTETLVHILILLGVTMAVVILFQRLYIPANLGYLLVGVMLGPHTIGPTVHVPGLKAIAEFGVVFLLFTIGLNFALPQLHALRHQVLGLGTAQVARGRKDGHPVMYGDLSDPELLQTLGIERAALVVVSLDHGPTALRTVSLMSALFPQVPVIARARDLQASRELLEAGAAQAYPETLEASLLLGECTLKMLQVPEENIAELLQEIRDWGYRPVAM